MILKLRGRQICLRHLFINLNSVYSQREGKAMEAKWKKVHIIILIIVLVTGLLIRIMPLLPPPTNLIHHSTDDSFYLYAIADNLLNGKGVSFDGVTPTSTSRPLYIIFLAGLDWLVGRTALPQIAYLLGALADFITALLIIRFLRHFNLKPFAIIIGAAFYVFSARIIYNGVNGMETPFAMLSIAVLLNLYLIESEKRSVKILAAIARGIAMAAMMLLRLDYVFLVGTALLFELWRGIKHRSFEWLWASLAAGITMLPWVWWSLASWGQLMPPSGDALAIVFGFKPGPGLSGVVDLILNLYYAFNNPLHMLIFLFQLDWAIAIGYGFIIISYCFSRKEVFGKNAWLDVSLIACFAALGILPLYIDKFKLLSLLGFIALGIYMFFRLYGEKSVFADVFRRLAPLALGLLFATLYYGLIRRYFRGWNLIEGDIFLSILLAAMLSVIINKKGGLINIVLLTTWVMISSIYMGYPNLKDGPLPYQDKLMSAVRWVRANTSQGTVIASVYGGLLQFYSGRELVDIAGNEDPRANKALKEKNLYNYLKQRGVKYVIDPDFCPFKYYREYWGVDISQKLVEVYDTDIEGKPDYNFPEQVNFRVVVYELK